MPCVPEVASVLRVPFLHLVWCFLHTTPTSLFAWNFLLLLICVFTSSSVWVLIHLLFTKPSTIAWVHTPRVRLHLNLVTFSKMLLPIMVLFAGQSSLMCMYLFRGYTWTYNSTILQDWENQSHHFHNTACQASLQPLSFTAHVMLTAVPTLGIKSLGTKWLSKAIQLPTSIFKYLFLLFSCVCVCR